jgi:hypothetical protein
VTRIVTDLDEDLRRIVIVKVALLLLPDTVTLAETLGIELLLLDKDTTAPPLGSAPQCHRPRGGISSKYACRAQGVIVSADDLMTPAYAASMVRLFTLDTFCVVTVKVALVLPAATVTVSGPLAPATVTVSGPLAPEPLPLLLDKETTAPPLGAAPLSVTVPVEEFPPTTVDGLRENDTNVAIEEGLTVRVDDLLTPM